MSEMVGWRKEESIQRLADWLCRHGLAAPAMFLLEANRPLNFLGGQALYALQPLIGPLIGHDVIAAYARLLEEPASVDRLLACLQGPLFQAGSAPSEKE
ncbi:MAG: hypothetical protein ACOYZ7_14565 [Chloroflexota bacterium]